MVSTVLFVGSVLLWLVAVGFALAASRSTAGRARGRRAAHRLFASGSTLTEKGWRYRRLSLLAGALAIVLMLAARWTR
jgi:hypothetical protein